jgi:hypothetical protein
MQSILPVLRLPPVIRHNPIVRAEFRHQRFLINNSRSGFLWIALASAMVFPTLLFAGYLMGIGVFGIIYPPLLASVPDHADWFGLLNIMLVVMAFSLYVVVTLITLGLSTNSVRRERNGRTWDNLRLTDISDDKIVVGKWYASLRALRGDHVMATVLRMGFVAQFIVPLNPEQTIYLPALLLITAVYGFLDAGLTAALGILASVAEDALGAVVGSVAIGVRIVTMVAATFWFFYSMTLLFVEGIEAVLLLTLLGFAVYLLLILAALYTARRIVA